MKSPPSPIASATKSSSPLAAPARSSAAVLPQTTHSRKSSSKQLLRDKARCHMVSREDLRRLADFECRPGEFAITFYYQPAIPKDKSHREESIQAKDVVRKKLQELELKSSSRAAVNDLHRISQVAETLHGNQGSAKVVFSCSGQNIWHEFDVPPVSFPTRLFVNRRFHLKPLAAVFSEYPKLSVPIVDRQNARVLEVEFNDIREQMSSSNPLPRHGRSDSFGGYDGGHAQRHKEDEIRRHFRDVADFLKTAAQRKQFDALVFGCN